jgi:hypothetical protein
MSLFAIFYIQYWGTRSAHRAITDAKQQSKILVIVSSSSSAHYSPLLDIGLSNCSPSRSIFGYHLRSSYVWPKLWYFEFRKRFGMHVKPLVLGAFAVFNTYSFLALRKTVPSSTDIDDPQYYVSFKFCIVWYPWQTKRIASLSFFQGCRKRRLKD